MKNLWINADGTVTYSIFQAPKDEGGQPPAENNEGSPQETSKKLEEKESSLLPHRFIPDVTREPKIKFFKVPRLGSYLAISLKYKSCLYDSCLENAVKAYYTTMEQRAKQEKEQQEKEQQEEKEKEKEPNDEEAKKQVSELPKIEEPPYETFEREYVLCLDTLGQDRAFSEEEKNFAIEIANHVIMCWEESEKQALTADKNLRITFKTRDEETKKDIEALNEELEKAASDALSEETRTDLKEGENDVITGAAKIKCMAKQLSSGKYNTELLELRQFTILLFPRIFQYAFYLLGYERKDICEPETNRLWWVERKHLIDEKFFTKLLEYTPLGPKTGVYPKYRLINAIEKNLADIPEEKVAEYCTAYHLLLKWIKECIKVRKLDIAVRKAKRIAAAQEKEAKTNEKAAWETKKAEELKLAIEDAKAKWLEEKKKQEEENQKEEDEFENLEGHVDKKEAAEFSYDEQALLADWIEKNPMPDIPAVMPDEQDNDYEQNAPA